MVTTNKPVRLSTVFARANDAYFSSRSARERAAVALERAVTAEGLTVVGRCVYCANLRPTVTLCSNCGGECQPLTVATAVRHVRESCVSAGLVED